MSVVVVTVAPSVTVPPEIVPEPPPLEEAGESPAVTVSPVTVIVVPAGISDVAVIVTVPPPSPVITPPVTISSVTVKVSPAGMSVVVVTVAPSVTVPPEIVPEPPPLEEPPPVTVKSVTKPPLPSLTTEPVPPVPADMVAVPSPPAGMAAFSGAFTLMPPPKSNVPPAGTS